MHLVDVEDKDFLSKIELNFGPTVRPLLKKILSEATTIDAVSVVRCAKCKHQRERNEYERNYLAEGVLICTSPDATDDCWNAVWPDHFCSYGERRSDD